MSSLQFKKDQMSAWAVYLPLLATKKFPLLEKHIQETLNLAKIEDLKAVGKKRPPDV